MFLITVVLSFVAFVAYMIWKFYIRPTSIINKFKKYKNVKVLEFKPGLGNVHVQMGHIAEGTHMFWESS